MYIKATEFVVFTLSFIFICMPNQYLMAQNSDFYSLDQVQEIKLNFDYQDWDYRLDTAKAGKEDYILATACYINGVKYDSVGVKYKGNSSYKNNQVKNPLHIKLDWILGSHDYQKYSSIKLGNNFSDPSAVREVLSYKILSNYMDCSQANFSKLFINDKYIGLYTNVEAVNKKFCSDHFGSSDHVFVKGNPDKPGNNSTSNLVFNGYDSSKYYIYYGMENVVGWYKLIALMDTLKNNAPAIPKILDVDRAIWMHAFNSVFSNYDSYTGSFSQNYYLYEDDFGRFLPVIWDLNMSIGGFPGSVGGGGGTTVDKITFFNGESTTNRPLLQKLLQNPSYKKMYTAHVRTFCKEFIANKAYETMAIQLQSKVDSLVKTDPNSLTTYSSFKTSLTAAISSGGGFGTAPGISTLMNARLTYFNTVNEFNALPPGISNIVWLKQEPKVGDTLWVNLSISNGNTAFLAYRKNKSYPFEKQPLFDDGLHHDSAANDGIYGTYMIAETKKTQYYIYAENNLAGIFSPERAEYEFYTLEATEAFADINNGDVVVNEFMTSNKTTVIDPSDSKYEDWAELYNNTNQSIDLSGLYLSDDYEKKDKWEFPKGTLIPAKNRIVLWLDEDSSDSSSLHTNFKLSATGEALILSRPDGLVIDSLSFGAIPTDNSYERCPDGLGTFKITTAPSYNKANCNGATSTSETEAVQVLVYPNPADQMVHVQFGNSVSGQLQIADVQGKFRESIPFNGREILNLSVNYLEPGMYVIFFKFDNGFRLTKKLSITGRS